MPWSESFLPGSCGRRGERRHVQASDSGFSLPDECQMPRAKAHIGEGVTKNEREPRLNALPSRLLRCGAAEVERDELQEVVIIHFGQQSAAFLVEQFVGDRLLVA